MTKTKNTSFCTGSIAWMAKNSVAANLMMAVLLIGGLFMGFNVKQEVFPEFSIDMVIISVSYPGASPEEVENGILLAIEEAVLNVDGIDEISATANEGYGSITIEAIEGTNINIFLQEIKSEVDRINTFPDEAKEPQISIASRKREVLKLALYGDASETTMRTLADQIRDKLLADKNITQVTLDGVKDMEIQIEIPEHTLRRYDITFQDVAQALSYATIEVGGGSIKTDGGDILLRITDKKEYAKEYATIPIITLKDGSNILLGDIASIKEGFEETDNWTSYNGKRAVIIEIYRVGNQTPTGVSTSGKKVVKQIDDSLPEGINLTVIRDLSNVFAQRADLLLRNAYLGLGLVFFFLALFLEIRLAFWVSLGIPISFLGSFIFLSPTIFSINMVSMFAFIVTLGIVVDDAVVVGENIYYYRKKGLSFIDASIKGTKNIAMPVIFSVITNMVAFLPLMFIPGFMGKIFKTIPMVVIAVFGVSLIESLYILPAHLNHKSKHSLFFPLNYLEKWQISFSNSFEIFIKKFYGNLLLKFLHYRYTVIAFGIALLMITVGYISSGKMGMVMFPKIESDYAFCEAILPYGVPVKTLKDVEQRLVQKANTIIKENGKEQLATGIFSKVANNKIQVRIYLTPPEIRPLSTSTVTSLWRKKVGRISGLEAIAFESDRGGPGSGKTLTVSLSHRDNNLLNKAGEELAQKLSAYSIVHDLDDGSAKGKKQFDITLLPIGKRMGLTSREVGNQIRNAFQGISAVTSQRGRNEVTVVIRLLRKERMLESTFENLVLKAPQGEILLRNAVEITIGRAYTSIKRINGKREISVTCNVRPPSKAESIMKDMKKKILPELVKNYPGLSYSFKGRQADIKESLTALFKGLIMALLCIFVLLAIPFKSYLQPFIIMFCIPFGIIGAVFGHLIMGYSLSIMSIFGLLAMSGVVINDSLVLIDYANQQYSKGMAGIDAVHLAGIQRFRPILLTTLTTCGGLAPIITESSRQARFLIPMAISLGFGILFATFITLVMVPSLYLILEDIKKISIKFAKY